MQTSLHTPFRTKIAGVGSYCPEKKLTNYDLEKIVETNHDWIVERTGIVSRRHAKDGEFTSDLALEAAKKALEMAEVKVADVDAIFVCTVSGDQVMPSTACVLQDKLGARNVFSLDLSAACSGFVYGLATADQFVRCGTFKNVLVVGAEVLHRFVNYDDRETCILFGDGAGAAVLQPIPFESKQGLLSHHLHADGSIGDLFVLPAGGSKIPFNQQVLDDGMHWVRMKGREIFKHAVRTMSEACHEALTANGMTAADVDWIIPHQANIRIIEAVAKHFGAPMEKVIVEIADVGNTSAATIPIALDRAVRDGRIKRDQVVLLTAFGAGITSGSLLLRF